MDETPGTGSCHGMIHTYAGNGLILMFYCRIWQSELRKITENIQIALVCVSHLC
jgi:hypothetical protein